MSSVTLDRTGPATRMRADERRELVLGAAAQVFAERGYIGATTDAVAKAAGVSQPYVVRMFGTKAALFLAVLERSLEKLLAMFRAAIAEATPEEPVDICIGRNYVELLRDRGILMSLMQAFMLGADPEIGPAARAGWMRVYRLLRDEAGLAADEITQVLAYGMLINTLVGVQIAADWEDGDVREMLEAAMPSKAAMLRELVSGAEGTTA